MLWNVHSYYSLRYGVLSIDHLVDGLVTRGYDTAVLTDINNSTGSLQFIKACQKRGIKGLTGVEFRNGDELLYIGVARNEEGFKELNELLTAHNKNKSPFADLAPQFKQVSVIYPYERAERIPLRENEFIGIRHIHLNKIRMSAGKRKDRLVLWQPVTFYKADQYKLHVQLRAIQHNLLISQLSPGMYADQREVFPTQQELLYKFKDFPFLIENTRKLLDQCSFNFDFKLQRNKKSFTGNSYDDRQLLFKYAQDGFARRYGKNDKVAWQRLLKELEIIDKLNFSAYFLITDDICRYARSRGFYYVGRGSGANSIVAFCLGITEVCPIELNLYFERFLNPARQSPPDFDIDFSWRDRDEMYNYIFHRYQSGHTALMGAMSTFRSRSIIRELGKVYGLPKADIDRMIDEPDHMLNKNEVTNMVLSVYEQMADFPNQRTIHSSGVVISEEPITNYCALDYPPKGLPTMQFDMYVAEEIGYEKFDILSQRGIGHINDCVEIVKYNTGQTIDVHRPKEFFIDPKINARLRTGDTIGCFYIESPAMRQLLSKLRCASFPVLVAASSIIRPGVSSSGMMKAYIQYHLDPSSTRYIHPVMEEVLGETYGVMVYQEDVMKIGHIFGGLDLDKCDVLRRGMSGKFRDIEVMQEITATFYSNCQLKGYPEAITKEVWRQMESFAGYSFCKAHSASFAVESYQSLYLKTYYPIEFMTAVLNNYGGFYHRSLYLHEARKAGANIMLPCVNHSGLNASLTGKDIWLGFDNIHGLEAEITNQLLEERQLHGAYTSLHNFILRTGCSLEQLIILIRIGAFRFTLLCKKALLWEAHILLSQTKRRIVAPLFNTTDTKQSPLPVFETSVIEDQYDEIEFFGFPITAPLFDMLETKFRGECKAATLANYAGRTIRIVGQFVCDKTVYTKHKDYMKFGCFLDDDGHFFDTVHFPPSLKQYPLKGGGIYLIQGKVVLEFGYPGIEVEKIAKLPIKPDPRSL